jgi:hypothetical protein
MSYASGLNYFFQKNSTIYHLCVLNFPCIINIIVVFLGDMKFLGYFILFALFSISCIEGPVVEQDLFLNVPDGKAVVIIRHFSFLDRTAEQRGMTTEEYRQYLVQRYGETRSLRIVRNNGPFSTSTEIGVIEIQTISESFAGLECAEITGAVLRLDPGEYEVYDNEVTFNLKGRFFLDSNDYLQDCIVERVSHD